MKGGMLYYYIGVYSVLNAIWIINSENDWIQMIEYLDQDVNLRVRFFFLNPSAIAIAISDIEKCFSRYEVNP